MQAILVAILILILILLLVIGFCALITRPENMAGYDADIGRRFETDKVSKQIFDGTAAAFAEMLKAVEKIPEDQRVETQRQGMEAMAAAKDYEATFVAVAESGVEGEWVLPPHGRVTRKVLFIHGGFFTMGSPQTHRPLTSRIARDCDAAVFSVKYSLQPENPRKTMIAECRRAYEWLASATVPGFETAETPEVFIMGDSAGGNLSLVTGRWATRQPGLPKPAGVVALSASTDATMSSLSRENAASDLLVGPVLAPVLKLPGWIWRLSVLAKFKVRVNDPEISPLFGNLAGLPRTLLIASSSEMMLGDSQRYANKARAGNSDVELLIWEGLPHCWLGFDIATQATEDGWSEITRFMTAG